MQHSFILNSYNFFLTIENVIVPTVTVFSVCMRVCVCVYAHTHFMLKVKIFAFKNQDNKSVQD